MTETTRLWVSLCAVLVTACGAGDTRLDPSDLELRDLLGLSPEVASSWDAAQRAAARHVIEAGLRQRPTAPARAAIREDAAAGDPPGDAIDRRVARALASIDVDRARHRAGALGAVAVVVGRSDLVATPRASTLAPRAAPPVDVELRGWTEPALRPLPARGMDVLAALASDAGHAGGSLIVAPAPELAVVAGYLPASADGPARLVVNPVVLAVLEPRAPNTAMHQAAVSTATPSAAAPAVSAAQADDGPIGNPYSFYGSVAECAAAQQSRCDACLAHNACTTITGDASGADECRQLAANGGRGYSLICINLALAIDEVASCAASDAPACSRDVAASKSLRSLEANATFLDNATCAAPLDACLSTLYGAPNGGFPGSGSGSGRPRHTDIDCSDSCTGDTNCDSSPNCELDGPSCDAATDGECSDPDESSSCDGGSTGEGGGCSSDGEDACGSESSNNSCDSSDCGGGGDSDCGSSGGGESCDSGGGGGDCGGGGGGDCSGGGGGDCGGGGGGDCNVAGTRGRPGASLPVAIAWALLPIPLAAFVRRRAERRQRAASAAPIAEAAGAEPPAGAEGGAP